MELVDILIVSPFILIAIVWLYMALTGRLSCNLAGLDKFISLTRDGEE